MSKKAKSRHRKPTKRLLAIMQSNSLTTERKAAGAPLKDDS